MGSCSNRGRCKGGQGSSVETPGVPRRAPLEDWVPLTEGGSRGGAGGWETSLVLATLDAQAEMLRRHWTQQTRIQERPAGGISRAVCTRATESRRLDGLRARAGRSEPRRGHTKGQEGQPQGEQALNPRPACFRQEGRAVTCAILSVCLWVSTSACLRVHLCVEPCVSVSVSLNMCPYVYVSVHIRVCPCGSACGIPCICVSVSVLPSVCVHVCVCICPCTCMHLSACESGGQQRRRLGSGPPRLSIS